MIQLCVNKYLAEDNNMQRVADNYKGIQLESFKRSMGWTFCSTNTGFSVLCVFIGEWEFSQISTNHVEFDFDYVECFSIMDCHIASNHIGHDDGISKMGFYGGWLFTGLGVLFSFFAFHIESVVFVFDFYI